VVFIVIVTSRNLSAQLTRWLCLGMNDNIGRACVDGARNIFKVARRNPLGSSWGWWKLIAKGYVHYIARLQCSRHGSLASARAERGRSGRRGSVSGVGA